MSKLCVSKCFVCPLCGTEKNSCLSILNKNGYYEILCKSTRKSMDISQSVYEKYEDDWHILAGLISNKLPDKSIIKTDDADGLMTNRPSLEEQTDTILQYIEQNSPDPFQLNELTIPPYLVYCADSNSLITRCGVLGRSGYIRHNITHNSLDRFPVAIDLLGAKRLSEIPRVKKSDLVFIAMEYDTNYTETIANAAKKGCERYGLTARPVNKSQFDGGIPDRIVSDINRSAYVIADYTFGNQGVYYESGYARGRGIYVIETCNKEWYNSEKGRMNRSRKKKVKEPLHFDVRQRNIIFWVDEKDLTQQISDRIGSLTEKT